MLTRARFVVLAIYAYRINPQAEVLQGQNFADIVNDYYTPYLSAARSLGMIDGIGGNLFVPNRQISRQEMCVMLYNALEVLDQLSAEEEKEF